MDSIALGEEKGLNWRLHSQLNPSHGDDLISVLLSDSDNRIEQYKCRLLSHADVRPTLTHGYSETLTQAGSAIESDASQQVVHMDWQLPHSSNHSVVACCIDESRPLPEVRHLEDESVTELFVGERAIVVPLTA